MGRSSHQTNSLIENNGTFLTKPVEIANYFNNYFVIKVDGLRKGLMPVDGTSSCTLIEKCMMKNKNCKFDFVQIAVPDINKLLLSLPIEKPAGTDNLDGKLLRLAAAYISTPICHIFNRCLTNGVCLRIWKEAKIIPIPKDSKSNFTGANSRPISILSVLSKLLENIVFNQIQNYFIINNLITSSQHRESHSTTTALAQLTDDWLKHIDDREIVGTVLLDFSAAFDVIYHNILITKLDKYGFNRIALSWMISYLSER